MKAEEKSYGMEYIVA